MRFKSTKRPSETRQGPVAYENFLYVTKDSFSLLTRPFRSTPVQAVSHVNSNMSSSENGVSHAMKSRKAYTKWKRYFSADTSANRGF